jgi:hypothetical protein
MEIMRISSTNAIEGGRVLYTIGRIEDRQGTTLVLVARHEISMFPFERIRDVDRPARQ